MGDTLQSGLQIFIVDRYLDRLTSVKRLTPGMGKEAFQQGDSLSYSFGEFLVVIDDISPPGEEVTFSVSLIRLTPTVVSEESTAAGPRIHALHANRPNPFNATTQIPYQVSDQSNVSLTVYNILGQEIARLVDQEHSPGSYFATWNGMNSLGFPQGSGVYVYRLESSMGLRETARMSLVK